MAGIDYEVEYNNRARVLENPAIMAGWVLGVAMQIVAGTIARTRV